MSVVLAGRASKSTLPKFCSPPFLQARNKTNCDMMFYGEDLATPLATKAFLTNSVAKSDEAFSTLLEEYFWMMNKNLLTVSSAIFISH